MAESTPQTTPGQSAGGTIPPNPMPGALPQAAPSPQESSVVGAPVPERAPQMPERSAPFGQPEGAPALPGNLPNYQEQWQSGEAGPGLSPKPTKWDKMLEGLSQGAHDSFAGTLSRLYKEKSAETGQYLPPDQANAMNPYRAMPYTTPVDSGIVAMEAADGRRQQQVREWVSRNNGGSFGYTAGGFAGSFVDAPMYAAIGLATGGLGDLAAGGLGELAGPAGRLAGHFGVALGEFSMVGQAQNKLEASMGAREKPITQVITESLGGAAIATGLGALARRFLNRGEGTPEALQRGVKENAAALANDEKIPALSERRAVTEERSAGVTLDPNGNKIVPTLQTSPIQEAKLYGATHADGTPLTHEHGLGTGVQLTDSREVANNGVARSSEQPGQVAETKLPEGAQLLDIDRPASSEPALVKAIEDRIGTKVDPNESLKDIITNLGDWAGAESGDTKIPEDILQQIQGVAKEQGYAGYQFNSDNSRQVHVFDRGSLEFQAPTQADPTGVPQAPDTSPQAASPEAAEAQERAANQNYSPSVQQALNDIRKTAMTIHPDNLSDQIAQTEKILADQEQRLQQLAKDSPLAEEALKELREQKVHDARMLDVAKRIINCGASE